MKSGVTRVNRDQRKETRPRDQGHSRWRNKCQNWTLWFIGCQAKSLVWTFPLNKHSSFAPKMLLQAEPTEVHQAITEKTIGQIELILSRLKPGPKITQYTKMSKKWELRVFSACRNVAARPSSAGRPEMIGNQWCDQDKTVTGPTPIRNVVLLPVRRLLGDERAAANRWA